jgi:hypothetical protein
MESLKNKVEEILKVNSIDFEIEYHHKGNFVNITGANEIKDDLETWIDTMFLTEYLISKDILYNYSGSFILKESKIFVSISFKGPYNGEFEQVELPIDLVFSDESLKAALLKAITTEIDFSELFMQFGYDEDEGFEYFNLTYWDKNNKDIDMVEKLGVETITKIKEVVEMSIIDNVPCLILPPDLIQNYYAECEENSIRYIISSSDLEIEWDEIEN